MPDARFSRCEDCPHEYHDDHEDRGADGHWCRVCERSCRPWACNDVHGIRPRWALARSGFPDVPWGRVLTYLAAPLDMPEPSPEDLQAVTEDSRRLNSTPHRVEYRLSWFVDPSRPGADEPWFAEDDTSGTPEPGGVKHTGFFTSLSRAREYRDRIVVPGGGMGVRLESSDVIEVATPWKAVEDDRS